MTSRQYHYLVAGLPGISIGERLWTNLADFRDHLEVHLHPEDFNQVKYVLLQHDHQNLLHFLEYGEIPTGTAGTAGTAGTTRTTETAGNFTLEDLQNPEDHLTGGAQDADPMPDYMRELLVKYAGDKGQMDRPGVQRELDEGFLKFIIEKGNDFLRSYYTFHYDLNNLLAFIKAGAHQMDQQKFMTGDTPHVQHLREYAGRNLAKDPDLEQFDEIFSISEKPSFADLEKTIDQLRWRVIDEMNLFEYFTIDRILGYLIQMEITERWEKLDRESGEKQLRKLIDVSYRKLADEQRVQQAASE